MKKHTKVPVQHEESELEEREATHPVCYAKGDLTDKGGDAAIPVVIGYRIDGEPENDLEYVHDLGEWA